MQAANIAGKQNFVIFHMIYNMNSFTNVITFNPYQANHTLIQITTQRFAL